MNERQQIYDRLCALLTGYEQSDRGTLDYIEEAEAMYDILKEIQRKWETVITKQE